MYRSSLILTVKTALKSVEFSRSYKQNKLALFFIAHGVFICYAHFLSHVHMAELCSVQYCCGFSLYPSVFHMLVFES